jgi:hypothetical protein
MVLDPLVAPEVVADDWSTEELWVVFAVEFTSVDCWFAATSLVTV